ncbi:MAG TPA: tetratricopeptide repeat protein [Anaeromyxobacteraceae bacterium]|nr:tetratricopeptide repeat protein [Anaeromyxobacteraceae bacterium]
METPQTPARARFATLLERPEIPLDEAALAIAAEEYPDLDAAAYLARLDRLAKAVGAKVGDLRPPLRVMQAIREVLRDEERFHGNEKDYYDPRNSFLNEVLERRLGIPITLSLLTIEVARRLGLRLEGVAFPGHFLVKCPAQPGLPGEVFVDAFNGWELLGAEECTARFRAVLHGRPFDPTFLEAVDGRHILSRLLHNLKRIYVEKGDDVRALWVVDRLLLLQPENLEERRDRGLVAARLGGTAAAVRDLEAYVRGHPRASDVDDVKALLRELGGKASLLN